MAFILPRLTANYDKQPGYLPRAWNEAMSKIETLLNAISAIPEIKQALATLDQTVASANTAIEAANQAAVSAAAAAGNAQSAADVNQSVTSLANSYVTPSNVLSATSTTTEATINIALNTRVYGDGSTVVATAGSIPGLALDTNYYVYYDDPTRVGGIVNYMATTSSVTAAQVGNRHTVGLIKTPVASGTEDGDVVGPPGVGAIYKVLQ